MDKGAECYRRFLDGDDNGLIEIIRDHKDGLILYLNNYVSNISIAEELAEDTFVKIGLKKPKDTRKSSFKTWLYTIGRNTALDYLRKERHAPTISIDLFQDLELQQDSLEQCYIQQEQKTVLLRSIKKLKPEYCEVLWLTYFEGFSHKEAAGIMKKSVHNIDTLVWRAKKALKAELFKEGFVYEEC